MLEVVVGILVVACLLGAIHLLCIPIFLIAVKLKASFSKMTSDTWDDYFNQMTGSQFKQRFSLGYYKHDRQIRSTFAEDF
ncbi:MAG: hypothetical protein ACRC6H_06675 [Culicoidibacterales bacterium]